MIALSRCRDTCVYVKPRELSLFFNTLTFKGNLLEGLGLVLWDANVYVKLRELSLFFSYDMLAY
jgi:hypothetical protein